MRREAREQRARRAKQVFDFMAAWEPPALGGEPPAATKSALLQESPGLVEMLLPMIAAHERHALLEWQAYRETIASHEFVTDGGLGVKEHGYDNIYDVLFTLQELYGHNDVPTLYRGHYDSSWRPRASYYRSKPGASWKDRTQFESGFRTSRTPPDELSADELDGCIVKLRNLHPTLELDGLSPLQKEAVVQHYLSGTKLLDFTRSMYVAGYFATKAERRSCEFGALYALSPTEPEEINLAAVKVVELPDRFARIHRQDGVFLRIHSLGEFEHPALWLRWLFHHTEVAFPFECESLNITTNYLMSDKIESGPW